MIEITNSPTFTQSTPSGSFDYNVLAVVNNITYSFRSLQARLYSIDRTDGNFALVTLRDNITDYLQSVEAVIGSFPTVFIDDNLGGLSLYTGAYRATSIQTINNSILGKVTQFVARNIGDNSPTYAGDKVFPDGYGSQLAYKYRDVFTFEVYDVTHVASTNRNRLLTTVRQQSNADGSVVFNISEVARGYTPSEGALTLQVHVNEADYFGNTSALVATPAHFIEGRLAAQNYANWTLFNPDTGGSILPSTGRRLLYSTSEIYPFWVNFVTNDLIVDANKMILVVRAYQGSLVGTERVEIPVQVGLNSIDLSQFAEVVDMILMVQPDRIGLSVEMTSTTTGQFGDQFGSQFYRISDVVVITQVSDEFFCGAMPYTLDNRRDFYFAFDNGSGGRSVYLCNQFTKATELEIVPLRNSDTISNNVARETESVELTFKYEDLGGLRLLLGYDPYKLIKEGGVFESKNVTRIGSQGDTKQWIIKGQSYNQSNADVFKDLSLTLYRPLSSGFETPIPTRLKVLDVDLAPTAALVLSAITQAADIVLERGVILGETYYAALSDTNAFGVQLSNLTPNTSYVVRAYARTSVGVYYSYPKTFVTSAI